MYKCIRFLSKETGTTLINQNVASSKSDEKENAELEVKVAKMIGLAAGIATDRSTLPPFHASLQWVMEDHNNIDYMPLLYV